MSFEKGRTPWNKGKKTGLVPKTAYKRGYKFWLGKKLSKEHKKKLSLSKTGKIPWNKGKIGVQAGKSGASHWNWQGGISPINRQIRKSVEYKLWRTAVFERDNYTCVWCGNNKGSNLNADHIKPFSIFPELRFAIDNGRTLCEDCHKTTDTYGWKLYHSK